MTYSPKTKPDLHHKSVLYFTRPPGDWEYFYPSEAYFENDEAFLNAFFVFIFEKEILQTKTCCEGKNLGE